MTTATKIARLAQRRRMKLLEAHQALVEAALRTTFLSPDDVVVLADPTSDALARHLVRGRSVKVCVVPREQLHATFGLLRREHRGVAREGSRGRAGVAPRARSRRRHDAGHRGSAASRTGARVVITASTLARALDDECAAGGAHHEGVTPADARAA